MIEKYEGLTEEQLYEKMSFIQKKLDCAYSSNVGQEYIDFLNNQVTIIMGIIEEKQYIQAMGGESGIVYDSFEMDKTMTPADKIVTPEEEKQKKTKKFSFEKFVKVYKNADEDI